MKTLSLGLRLIACSCLFMAVAGIAQRGVPPPTGSFRPGPHVPAAIVNAKRIFVANAGADSGLFPQPFSGDPDRGYNQLYTALQAVGRYQLVDDPSQADLVLELHLIAPYGPTGANKVNGAADPLPSFRLVIYDARSHFLLWALTESIEVAYIQKTHDRNFDEALSNLITDFDNLSIPKPPTP